MPDICFLFVILWMWLFVLGDKQPLYTIVVSYSDVVGSEGHYLMSQFQVFFNDHSYVRGLSIWQAFQIDKSNGFLSYLKDMQRIIQTIRQRIKFYQSFTVTIAITVTIALELYSSRLFPYTFVDKTYFPGNIPRCYQQ